MRSTKAVRGVLAGLLALLVTQAEALTNTRGTADTTEGCVRIEEEGTGAADVTLGECNVEPIVRPITPLLISGQVTCWNVAGTVIDCADTGQDGEIRAGVTPRYTSRDDGTIIDHTTGLTWEKKTAANMLDAYTFDDAFVYVAGLNATRFGGHDDWRLPNIRELQSLIDYGRFDPAVAPEFNDCARGSCTVSGSYWSSTQAVSAGILAWRVNFVDGFQITGGKTFQIRVRAVRGGR